MKKLMKSLMLFAAAAMALTSCENEAMNEGIETNDTVTMTFTAGAPESKTAINTIDDYNKVVSFKWNDDDVIAFIQETDKTSKHKSKSIAIDAETDAATFTVELDTFSGSCNVAAYYPESTPPQDKTFGNVEVSLSGVQTLTKGSFDPKADLMMSQPVVVTSSNKSSFGGNLKFTRLAAIGRMNLKGVAAGETITQVKLTFADAEALNGTVTLDFVTVAATYGTDGTNSISLNGELTALEEGTTPIFFTCFPRSITGAYTIEVTTNTSSYIKEGNLSKALTFTAGGVLSFNASVNKVQKADKVDVLDRAFTGIASGSTSYAAWSGKTGTSGAVYAGNSAGSNDAIQLRVPSKDSQADSGIITTTSGGKATKVTVTWQASTISGRTLDIYGKNTAYTSVSDLYSSTTQGTKIGSIVCGTSTELEISDDYAYIGMRSASGAMYISQIEITWGEGDTRTALESPKVQADVDDDGKTISVQWNSIENAGSYTLSYGETVVENAESPYEFEGEYSTTYEFSVVAIPTNDTLYKNSVAGTAKVTTGANPTTPGEGDGTVEEPFDVTRALYYINNKLHDENAEVYVEGIVSTAPKSINTTYGSATYSISVDGTTTTELMVYGGLYLDKAKFTSTDQIKVGDEVLICGKLINYNDTTPEINSNNWIVKLVRGDVELKYQAISFDKTTVTITEGDEFTAPILSGAQTTVTYTSSDTTVATVTSTGAVTIVGTGTTTITATAAATNVYNEATASYQITVNAAQPGGGESKTFTENFTTWTNNTNTNSTTGTTAGDACTWSWKGASKQYWSNVSSNSSLSFAITLLKPGSADGTYVLSEVLDGGIKSLKLTARSNDTGTGVNIYVIDVDNGKTHTVGTLNTTSKKTDFTKTYDLTNLNISGKYQIKIANKSTKAYCCIGGLTWSN